VMYNPTDKSYIQARAIKKGKYRLEPTEKQIVEWIQNTFQVKALDFYFHKVETSVGYRQQHIVVILETNADCKKINNLEINQKLINKFLEYFQNPQRTKKDPQKNNLFEPVNGTFPEIVLDYCALESVELKVATTNAEKEIMAIAPRYKDIWTISKTEDHWIIFYYTQKQLVENSKNGTTEQIKNEILKELKKYDDFGYFELQSLKITFDSKEYFDDNFQGNWHYYHQ